MLLTITAQSSTVKRFSENTLSYKLYADSRMILQANGKTDDEDAGMPFIAYVYINVTHCNEMTQQFSHIVVDLGIGGKQKGSKMQLGSPGTCISIYTLHQLRLQTIRDCSVSCSQLKLAQTSSCQLLCMPSRHYQGQRGFITSLLLWTSTRKVV